MKFFKIFTLTFTLMIAAVFAINIPDRDLRPEVKEVVGIPGTPPASEIPDSTNAYFAVLGFRAPSGEDITAAGHRVHTEYYTSVLKSSQGIPGSSTTILGSSPPFAEAPDIPQCNPEEKGCLVYYREKKEAISQLLDENRVMLERYAQLQNYSGYQDLMRYNPWSSWADLTTSIYATHCLTAAKAALLFDQGERQQAQDMVVADILLWRKFLGGTADIAGKTYSFLALSRDYSLLDDMVSGSAQGLNNQAKLNTLATPLTDSEKSYDLIINGYLQTLFRDLQQQRLPMAEKKNSILAQFFLKKNATLNQAYDIFASLERTASIAPDQFAAELDSLEKKIQAAKEKRLDIVYNPLGKIFLATSFDSNVVKNWNSMIQILDGKITSLRNSIHKMTAGVE